jgi:rubrerythrin
VTSIENLDQAAKMEKDVLSAYQRVIEENICYWMAVEEDIADSYKKIADQSESAKVRTTLARLIEDSKDHIEALGSIKESFRKIAADELRHGKMLEELAEEKSAT